jgi:hypothetical protein
MDYVDKLVDTQDAVMHDFNGEDHDDGGNRSHKRSGKAYMFTLFFRKNWSKEVANEKQSVICRLKEKQSKSTRSADGHKGLALTMGQQVRTIGRWKSRGLVDWHGEGCVQ